MDDELAVWVILVHSLLCLLVDMDIIYENLSDGLRCVCNEVEIFL